MRRIANGIFILTVGAWLAVGLTSSAWAGEAITATSSPPVATPGPPARARQISDDAVVKEGAAAIDVLIDGALARDGTKRLRRTIDHQFLRRAYLDLAGRIPTRDEALDFLSATRPDRRTLLIRRLLASEAYVSTTFELVGRSAARTHPHPGPL